jgi:hypothetical protein
MTTKQAIKHFGGVSKLRDALHGLKSRQAIYQWGKTPPYLRQVEIEKLTNGALKAQQ